MLMSLFFDQTCYLNKKNAKNVRSHDITKKPDRLIPVRLNIYLKKQTNLP